MLKNVFSPVRLSGLELTNRVLMSSMHLSYEGADQYERMAHFYALRAKNGPGLIVTAGCSPDVPGRAAIDSFSLDDDRQIDEHRKITCAVHAAGDSRIALQLLHCGREAFHGRLVAPSPLRLPGNIFKPAELSHEQILVTAADYAKAARRAVEAGYDAVELLFSQGFLIHQFLSPHTNLRKDQWGGSLEARMRLAVLVASSVREAVGPAFPLIFRIPCLDLLDNGLRFEDSMALIEALLPYQIDLLNISIGWHESRVPTLANVVPQAGFASTAARVKQRFPHLMCCVSNRINDMRQAEELLIEGVADMVAMARPFLADREIVAKAAQLRFDEVNHCIACNQDCLDHMFLGHEIGCSVNPECGKPEEGDVAEPMRTDAPVAIVGGGLAGMVAAEYLARRGVKVTLFERGHRLGGQMLLASKIPGKSEFASTVRHYEGLLRASGVQVRFGCEFGAQEMAEHRWMHVVIATGTDPTFNSMDHEAIRASLPGFELAERPRVLGWHELLDKDLPVAFPVVICGGGGVACDVAKYLLRRRDRLSISDDYLHKFDAQELIGELPQLQAGVRAITIVQRSSKKIGYKIGRTTRWIVMDELEAGGVLMLRGATITALSSNGVDLSHQGEVKRLLARTVIMATGQQPNTRALCALLEQGGVQFSVIGAADPSQSEPASISSSVKSGYVCAMKLCETAHAV